MADKKEKKKDPGIEASAPEEHTGDELNAEDKNDEAPETPDASQQIKALNEQVAQLNDRLLRTAAEYDNFRKRSQKEKEAIYADSKAELVAKFLPVLDNFERAAAAGSDFEGYKKGIEMTVKQLLEVFTAVGVESFGEKGDAFDPNIHNGVMHIDDEGFGDSEIAEVFMKGYKLGDRVIRHATVKVAN